MRWGGIFDVDAKLIEISNEEEKTFAPDFWNNAKEAELIVKNLRNKKKWIEDYDKAVGLADELQLAYEFYKEGELTSDELDEQYQLTQNHIEGIEFKNISIRLIKPQVNLPLFLETQEIQLLALDRWSRLEIERWAALCWGGHRFEPAVFEVQWFSVSRFFMGRPGYRGLG